MSRFAQQKIDQKDEEIKELLAEIQKEKDERKEDYFLLAVAVAVLLNAYLFMQMHTFTGPLVILVLELIILIPIAKRLRVEFAAEMLDRILNMVPKFGSGN